MFLENEYLRVEFSTLGGALTSIKDKDGVEYLWQGNPEYWGGQAPVLFPICGSVRNDKVMFKKAGKEIWGQIPRHGLVRKSEFTYEKLGEDSVSFSIKSDEATYNNFPYHFELKITYTLTEKTVRTTYQVTNLEQESEMPYFVGGHPGFNCPLMEGESYEDYYLEFDEVETCTIPKQFPDTGLLDCLDRKPFLVNQTPLDLNYDLFSVDAITMDQLQSRSVALKSRKHDKGLRFDFEGFPNLILWSTLNKGPFIALEPWSGLSTSLEESDFFEDKKNVSLLTACGTRQHHFEITIL